MKPGEPSEKDMDWAQDRRVKTIKPQLANSSALGTGLVFSVGIESTDITYKVDFPGKSFIPKTRELAISVS